MIKRFYLLLLTLSIISISFAQQINVVPYPSSVNLEGNSSKLLESGLTISTPKSCQALGDLLKEDLQSLFDIESTLKGGKADIMLKLESKMMEEEYKIIIDKKGIKISGQSYHELAMGVTTLLQMVEKQNNKYEVSMGTIVDSPEHPYRGFSFDIARQWIDIETVKQAVELCRWYKIRYMQLHMTDDQSFTFPTQAYPSIPTPNRHYTTQQLKDLVEYAKQRGVVIIPEFDVPAHTSAMRRAMPELFGPEWLSLIDISKEEACVAVETIMKEMMEIFYTSPYFHIGADEAWLGAFQKEQYAIDYVKKKGYDNVHDIHLEFIARMLKFVKDSGKKALIWESFAGTGSRKVTIPNDNMMVFAWETLYQMPQSLIKNDYQIINASWKPTYVCPGFRWSPQYIYEWNLRRWENHWNIAPSYKSPIQLKDNTSINGGLMCSWEMDDPAQISSLHNRIPAISEAIWNDSRRAPYSDFKARYDACDEKFQKLCFPAIENRSGFRTENDYDLENFGDNIIGDTATVAIKPIDDQLQIRYTLDGSKPTEISALLDKPITIKKSCVVKYCLFDKDGNILGYKSTRYLFKPIQAKHEGEILPLRDRNIWVERNSENFAGTLRLTFTNHKPNSEIRYTTDGKMPTKNSQLYTAPIDIKETQKIIAQCFMSGRAIGETYKCQYTKIEQ